MHFPPPKRLYFDAGVSRLEVLDDLGNTIDFTILKIISSIVHDSLTSDAAMRSASAAFGALTNILINKCTYLKVKGSMYI
jgi:hypothetical protein